MEQSLHQLRQELSLADEAGQQSGGYLNYIKSKYLKVEETEIKKLQKEWHEEYEVSQLHPSYVCTEDFSDAENPSGQLHSSIVFNDNEFTEREVILEATLYTGGSIGGPKAILFDNFIDSDNCDNAVDFGDYVPSGTRFSSGNIISSLDNLCLEVLPRASLTSCIERHIALDEIEYLVQSDDEEGTMGASSDEDDDDKNDDPNYFSADCLPPRIAGILNSIKDAPSVPTSTCCYNVYSPVGSKEISDVHDFEEMDDSPR